MSESTRNDELISKLFGLLDELKTGHSDIRNDLATMRAEMTSNLRDLDTLRKVTLGNGEPEKGLVSRVQSLREAEDRRRWLVGAAVVAGFASLGKMLSDWFPKLLH